MNRTKPVYTRQITRVLLIFVGILLLGALPRAVEMLNHNYLFGFDQGLFYQKVKQIAVDHKLTLIGEEVGGPGGFFQGPGFYYLLSLFFLLFRGDPYGGMVLMFVSGLATIVLAQVLFSRMLGFLPAMMIALLVAVSPAMVAQSRFIWNPFFIPPLILIIWFLFYKVLNKNAYALPLLFFVIGLLFHFEIATGIMVFAEFTLFSLVLWRKHVVRPSRMLGSLFAFGVTQVNFLLFDVRHGWFIAKGMLRVLHGGGISHQTTVSFTHILTNHWQVFWTGFLTTFVAGQHVWAVLVPLLGFGIYGLIKDRRVHQVDKLFVCFLTASPAVVFGLYLFYTDDLWGWWILDVGMGYVILAGIALAWLWRRRNFSRIGVGLLITVMIALHLRQTAVFYRTDYYDAGGTAKISGKLDALDFIYKDVRGEAFNLLVFTPPVYTYAYDYLSWWYGKKVYGYVPGKEKKDILYLLIEKDPEKPWSYQGWLETVIKTGKVVYTKSLPSGFIVQKRVVE